MRVKERLLQHGRTSATIVGKISILGLILEHMWTKCTVLKKSMCPHCDNKTTKIREHLRHVHNVTYSDKISRD